MMLGRRSTRPASLKRRVAAVLLLFAPVASLTACDSLSAEPAYEAACRSLGLCDEPLQAAVFFDVLCDPSVGSSCSAQNLDRTLVAVLNHVSQRPGSRVRLWLLGKNVAETVAVGEQTVPLSRGRSAHGRRLEQERFASSALEFFRTTANHAFEAPPIRRSPLAESFSKIALADTAGLARRLVAVTDGREVSTHLDFECGFLPTETRFLASLKERALFAPGSFTHALVDLVFMQSSPVPARGCPVQVEREIRMRALWIAAFKAAGATDVRVSSALPSLESESDQTKVHDQ
jgi:hypothetical protein